MSEEDIYGSKKKYERFTQNLTEIMKPKNRSHTTRKYTCRKPQNLKYFKKLFAYFDARDLSYIRRLRILQTLIFISHWTEKDFRECNREDIDRLMALMHKTHLSPRSKETFVKDLKFLWKTLFPGNDEKGRPDDTIVPYEVRHLSPRTDKSREKARADKFNFEEFEKIVNYFGSDPRIQAFLTLSLESLARPQELLYLKIGDVELYDSYAKICLSEHGKEGLGLLQCIDSFPYLVKWLSQHPLKNERKSFLFINTGNTARLGQLRPANINKLIHRACKDLGIEKPITCYSLKRAGVTFRRLRGESDMEIQHAARWTSSRQLKTYDLSTQDEAFRLALEKRGLIPTSGANGKIAGTKACLICGEKSGFAETTCQKCLRPLDRSTIVEESKKDEVIWKLRETIANVERKFESIKHEILKELSEKVLAEKRPSAV